MSSWDKFTAFGGKLTPSIFRPVLDGDVINYQKTCAQFTLFIQGLRQSPAAYGIPQSRVDDVHRLLEAFFPAPNDGNAISLIAPQRILWAPKHGESLCNITPIEVHIGQTSSNAGGGGSATTTATTTILIADSPSALGYIFSIASPPPGTNASFNDYYLPLAVCFAWMTYLAFLIPATSIQRRTIVTAVPLEACLSYLPGPSLACCLGATWSGADPGDAYSAGSRSNTEDAMDRWVLEHMVQPLLSAAAGSVAGLPPGLTPSLAAAPGPTLKAAMARRLNEYILGKVDRRDPAATPFLQPLIGGDLLPKIPGLDAGASGLSQVIMALGNASKLENVVPQAVVVDPELLISHRKTKPALIALLDAVLNTMTALTDQPALLLNIQRLIQFYVTPHVLDPLTGYKELPLSAHVKLVVDPLALGLPALVTPALQKKLHSLKCHVEHSHESSDTDVQYIERSYFVSSCDKNALARSPEVFPLHCVSAQSRSSNPPVLSGTNIRGMRLFPRALGQAILGGAFAESFSPSSLDKASVATGLGANKQEGKMAVVGPPSPDGGLLVAAAQGKSDGIPDGSYCSDAKLACPRSFALFE